MQSRITRYVEPRVMPSVPSSADRMSGQATDVPQVSRQEPNQLICSCSSPLPDSNRRLPPYHGLRSAAGRNRWQRFWLVSPASAPVRFATGCHRLRPRGSIKAPFFVAATGYTPQIALVARHDGDAEGDHPPAGHPHALAPSTLAPGTTAAGRRVVVCLVRLGHGKPRSVSPAHTSPTTGSTFLRSSCRRRASRRGMRSAGVTY